MQKSLLDYIKKEKYKCPKCGREFLTKRGLKIHLTAHKNREMMEKIRKEKENDLVEVKIKMDRKLFEKWDSFLRENNMQIEALIAILTHKCLSSVEPEDVINYICKEKATEYFT